MRLVFLLLGLVGVTGMWVSIALGTSEGPAWSFFCFAAAACLAVETYIGLRRN